MIRTKKVTKVKSIASAEELSNALGGRKKSPGQFMALCPAHDDHNPSLSIREDNKKILLYCFAGCGYKEIVGELKLNGIAINSHGNKLCQSPGLPKGVYAQRQDKKFAAYWTYKNEHGESLVMLSDMRMSQERKMLFLFSMRKTVIGSQDIQKKKSMSAHYIILTKSNMLVSMMKYG